MVSVGGTFGFGLVWMHLLNYWYTIYLAVYRLDVSVSLVTYVHITFTDYVQSVPYVWNQ